MARNKAAKAAATTSTAHQYGAGKAINGPAIGTLTFSHQVSTGTRVEGARKGDGSESVLGSEGQRWSYTGVGKYWHLGNSAGYAADVERITLAAMAARMGGYDAIVIIDDIDASTGVTAPVKVRSKASIDRIAECGRAANAQTRVTPAPVAPVATVAPVAEVPAPVAPVARRTRKATVTPVVAEVSATVAPVAPVDPFAGVGMADLLSLVAAKVPGALEAAIALHVTPVATVPAPVAPATPVTPVKGNGTNAIRQAARKVAKGAPVAPVTVVPTDFRSDASVIDVPLSVARSTADVAYPSARAVAKELRVRLNRSVAHVFGSKGDRPAVTVFRTGNALNVRIEVPANVDRAALVNAIHATAGKIDGVSVAVAQVPTVAVAPVATVARKARKAPVAPVAVAPVATRPVLTLAQVVEMLTASGVTIV